MREIRRCVPMIVLVLVGASTATHATTIISNLDGDDGTQSAGLDTARNKGMGFTMPNGLDYTLDDAVLRLDITSSSGAADAIVQIWSDVGGTPGAVLSTLNNPAFAPGVANYAFTPPAPLTLAANTTYWLVASGGGLNPYDWKADGLGILPIGIATHAGALFDVDGAPPSLPRRS